MVSATTTAHTLLAELGERYFRVQHTYDPYNATLLGISEFDHLAGDPSMAASEAAASALSAILDEVDAIDPEQLDESDLVDRSVLQALVAGARDDAHHSLWAAGASAKGYISRQALIFQAVPAMTVTDAASADRYLARLSGIGPVLAGIGDRYVEETARGRSSTKLGIEHSIQQLEGYLALDISDDALLGPVLSAEVLDSEVVGAGLLESGQAGTSLFDSGLLDRAREIVERDIRPAMRALAERLRTELLPTARDDDTVGIMNVEGGEEAYLAAVRRHTTTELSPAEIHQIGLDVLADMRAEWSEIGARALGESDFAVIAERMRADPALRFETREQILDVAQGALDRANDARPQYFPAYDITDCVLEEINPIDAEHAALAYYRPPAIDGSRPGAHCLLTTDPPSRFRFEYEALAFHESVPGHHLQLASAQKLDNPRYRRYLDVEACSFNEGWGLYAEQFADEAGLYSDDLSRLGMLSFRALRACRLVIDTGIHFYGWSRERAFQFMLDNTVTTEANARSEVDRYICWPGQALAYMIGCREIQRLRALAQSSLGADFSVIEFHRVVLGSGAVPLTVLGENVARWVGARGELDAGTARG